MIASQAHLNTELMQALCAEMFLNLDLQPVFCKLTESSQPSHDLHQIILCLKHVPYV